MKVLSREEKMKLFVRALYQVWYREVSDTIVFCSMEEALDIDIPPHQQAALLEVLRDKYSCLTFEEESCFKTREEIIEGGVLCKDIDEYDDEIDFERDIKETLGQKKITIMVNDKFAKTCEQFLRETDVLFRLHLSDAVQPVLYVNETPIRKFQSTDSYPCRIMRLALGFPNGSVVPVKDLLKASRGDRGCSQDLSDIFVSPVIKAVFAREITNSKFKIYHEITREDLKNVPYFQEKLPKGELDTIYLVKMIEECRISP